MGYPRDLREFIEILEEKKELRKINYELSPVLEIPELLRQVMRNKGPAILFENVKGYPGWRIAGNLFGTINRIKIALGVDKLETIGEKLVETTTNPPPITLSEKLRGLKQVISISSYLPKISRRAAFQELVYENCRDYGFNKIPIFKTWPQDKSRYITFGQVYTRDLSKGVINIGVYRVMILNSCQAIIHWQLHKRGRLSYLEAGEKDLERMEVAIVIGADPASMLVGVMPVPYPMDKLLFAGFMAGRGIEVFKLPSGILVPSCAEIVLEGYVEPNVESEEGPFGDHWGYYDKPLHKFPVFNLERVWMRRNPIYVGTIVGKPPLEDAAIGKAVERIFLPIIRVLLPEIVDINLPEHGMFQGLAIVSIKKRYPGHAKKVMMGLWGLGQMSLTKIIIVVDHDVDIHDINQVLWAVSANVDPQRDVVVIPYTHTDHLDPATPIPGYGSKLGIDATRKYPEEYEWREWPEEVEPDPQVANKIADLLKKLGII